MRLIQGDCLIESKKIKNGSVDLILTDLPYGTMNGFNGIEWDFAIEPADVYSIANRILRKNGKLVLFSQEPYTTRLITEAISNIPFSYRAIWEKDTFANALLVNKAMVGSDVMGFIGLRLSGINEVLGHRRAEHTFYINSTQYSLCTESTYDELINTFNIDDMKGFKTFGELRTIDTQFKNDLPSVFNLWEGGKYKSNILRHKKDYDGYHPTQKPVSLLEDLVKTFSNEGDLVVDLTMGSGSTGVACKNTNRDFIGIELDETYFNIAEQRIKG